MSTRTLAITVALTFGLIGAAAMHFMHGGPSDGPGPTDPVTGPPLPAPTGGGSGEHPPPSTDDFDSPADLVPRDAFMYLEVASFNAFKQQMLNVASRVDPMLASSFDPDAMMAQMLMMVGADAAQVDKGRSMGIAMAMEGAQSQPRVTLILPVRASAEFARTLRLPPGNIDPLVKDGYVGITMGSEYPIGRERSPIAVDLPPAGFAARIRLAAIRPQIMAAMEQSQADGEAVAELAGVSLDGYRAGYAFGLQVFESLEQVDLGLELGDEGMEILYACEFSEDGPLALAPIDGGGTLHELAGYVSEQDTFSVLAGWDQSFLDETIRGLVDHIAEYSETEEVDALVEVMERLLGMAPMLGHKVALTGRFELGASRLAVFCQPQAPDNMLGSFPLVLSRLNLESVGLNAGSVEHEKLDEGKADRVSLDYMGKLEDAQVRRIRQAFQMLFEGDQIEVRLASRGGHLALLIGGDQEWQQEQLTHLGQVAAPPPGGLEVAFERIRGDSPSFVYHVDMTTLTRSLVQLFAQHMGLDPSADLERLEALAGDDPLPVTVYGGVDGTRWRGGILFDWERLSAFVKVTQGSF